MNLFCIQEEHQRPPGVARYQDHRGACKPRGRGAGLRSVRPLPCDEGRGVRFGRSVEEALAGAECAVFLVDHGVFRGISVETVKGLMASPVVVDGKNLFAGGEGIVYLGIGKGTDSQTIGSDHIPQRPGLKKDPSTLS